MYYFLAFLGSLFIAVMIAVNGRLASAYGLYWSTSIFFLVGLIFISLSAVVRREKLIFRKETPFYLYLGGAVGFFTTFFNFMAINKISVTAILALSLFGQAAFSLVIDQFGFFEMPVRKMNYGKFLGLIDRKSVV